MTQKERQLLLKDLCARLPYGVKIKYLYWDENKGCEYPVPMTLDDINSDGYIRFHGDIAEGEGRGMITQYLPYLRPMSSMTAKEKEEYDFYCGYKPYDENIGESYLTEYDMPDYIDFLYEHHLDFRGLIPMGLALEAPERMYKTE